MSTGARRSFCTVSSPPNPPPTTTTRGRAAPVPVATGGTVRDRARIEPRLRGPLQHRSLVNPLGEGGRLGPRLDEEGRDQRAGEGEPAEDAEGDVEAVR